jgi:general secretion pathway protein I
MPTRYIPVISRLRLSRLPRHAFGACSPGTIVERGFSLLEVLVAFVILALVGTALFRLFSGALGNASAAGDMSRAVLVAESVLAETAAAQPLRETTQQGTVDDGRIEWTTKVAPYSAPDVNPDTERVSESMSMRLFRVSVEVVFPAANGGKRTIALATTRIASRDIR